MTRMMQGTVDQGTAAGLRARLGAAEMGGKTGTTNSNADFWFIGYTPQLMAGTWVGCDDRFITLESSAYFGGSVARHIWEAFLKKYTPIKHWGSTVKPGLYSLLTTTTRSIVLTCCRLKLILTRLEKVKTR